MQKRLWFVLMILMGASVLMGAAAPVVYFEMTDPLGDENGYGDYQYPSNPAFKPYKGLFDITEFKVWAERPGELNFDTTFAKVTNPWQAPEGYILQNLRIFIDTTPQQGWSVLPHPGAAVRFNPKYAWDVCLKIVGWGNSQLITLPENKLHFQTLQTQLMSDQRTIRARAPIAKIGVPNKHWRYYVLVGSYDGFGTDFFRKVTRQTGEWVIGGGYDQEIEPQLLDILATKGGKAQQDRQLHSFDLKTGRLAELEPVGQGMATPNLLAWFGSLVGLVLLGGLIWLAYRYCFNNTKISWFWVGQAKK